MTDAICDQIQSSVRYEDDEDIEDVIVTEGVRSLAPPTAEYADVEDRQDWF